MKCTLLSAGHYNNEPDKYRDLYDRYPSIWTRSPWRAGAAFLGSYWSSQEPSNTPSDLLNRLFDERYGSKANFEKMSYRGYWHNSTLKRLAKHKNVDIELAIKLSQCGDEEVKKLGFQKIVELSQ